jgi:hypothetical protein
MTKPIVHKAKALKAFEIAEFVLDAIPDEADPLVAFNGMLMAVLCWVGDSADPSVALDSAIRGLRTNAHIFAKDKSVGQMQ